MTHSCWQCLIFSVKLLLLPSIALFNDEASLWDIGGRLSRLTYGNGVIVLGFALALC